MVKSNRKNAYQEAYTILQELNEEEYSKIPPEVIQALKENRNEEYNYEVDEDQELKYQPMLPETYWIDSDVFYGRQLFFSFCLLPYSSPEIRNRLLFT